MQREPLRDGHWRVTVAVRYDESWSPALAFANSIGTIVKTPAAHKTSLASEGRSQFTAEKCRVPVTSERLAGEEFL